MTGERRLRELDDALRFSARAAGWREPDTTATGLLDEPEQDLSEKYDSLDSSAWRAILRWMPETARYMLWADYVFMGDTLIVQAKDPDDPSAEWVDLGMWWFEDFRELLRRHQPIGSVDKGSG